MTPLLLRRKPRPHGFTLIEILVVIGIIGVLAAILFPVFAKAREKARQAACLSNEKQMGLAFLQYAQDNDEILPPFYTGWAGGLTFSSWDAEVYPYVKSTSVFACPDDPSRPFSGFYASQSGYYAPAPYPSGNVRSYSINADYCNWTGTADSSCGAGNDGTGPAKSPMGATLAAITASSTTVLLAERFGNGCNQLGIVFCEDTRSGSPDVHLGGSLSNFLFADGHVRTISNARTASDAAAGVRTPSGTGFWDKRQQ